MFYQYMAFFAAGMAYMVVPMPWYVSFPVAAAVGVVANYMSIPHV